jgi:ribosomal protein L37E
VSRYASEKHQRCAACGYDLFGTDSDVCPECGTPREWRRLRYFDRAEFERARRVLEDAKIPIWSRDGGAGQAGIQTLYAGGLPVHEIGIAQTHMEEAIKALDEAEIPVPEPLAAEDEAGTPGEKTDRERKSAALRVLGPVLGLLAIAALSVLLSTALSMFVTEVVADIWSLADTMIVFIALAALIWAGLSWWWVFRPMVKSHRAASGGDG